MSESTPTTPIDIATIRPGQLVSGPVRQRWHLHRRADEGRDQLVLRKPKGRRA